MRTPQQPEEIARPLSIALSALDIGAQIALIGVLACRVAVLSRDRSGKPDSSTLHLLDAAVVLVPLASRGILLSRTLELTDGAHGLFADMLLALGMSRSILRWAS